MNTFLSLLEKISSTQVDDLIYEHKLKDIGYKFYYSLDNHDIHKYCFPGGMLGMEFEKDASGRINYNLETDVITAYSDFFNRSSHQQPLIFLEEYFLELVGLRNKIIANVENGSLFNYADKFSYYLTEHDRNRDNNSILNDFTLFISIATGLLKDGAQRFNSVVANKYFIKHDNEFIDFDNAEILKSVLRESFFSDANLVENIFDQIVKLKNFKRRFNSRIDSEAIARIVSANNKLLETFPHKKILILFLSTTESSKKVFSKILQYLPSVKGVKFNFHRTVEQLFLNNLIEDLPSEDKLARLLKAKELVIYREKLSSVDKFIHSETYNQLEESAIQSFHHLRENYINVNLSREKQFKKIEELHAKLSSAYINTSMGRLTALFNSIKETAKEFGGLADNIQVIQELENTFQIEQIILYIFKRSIVKLKNGQSLETSRGGDRIMGTGQHLPIVFQSAQNLKGRMLDELAELYLDQYIINNTIDEKDVLIKRLKEFTETVYETDNSSLEYKLILALYLLVLPETNLFQHNSNGTCVEQFLGQIYNKEKDNIHHFAYSDLLYAYSWVLRRNRKYKAALNITEEGIKEFPDDPRFYHSRFLISVCLIPEDLEGPEILRQLENNLNDIKYARFNYHKLLKGKSEIIQKNIEATLLNSDVYAELLMIANSRENEDLKITKLSKVKTEFTLIKQLMGDKYREYPEFLHTEAFLIFIDSGFEHGLTGKINKLKEAAKVLNEGMSTAQVIKGFDTKIFKKLSTTIEDQLLKSEEIS